MLYDIDLEQAWQLLKDNTQVLGTELLPLEDALNRVLSKSIYAPADLPPYRQAAVDGYALGDGFAGIGSTFSIVGNLDSGDFPGFSLKYGEAAAVLTGGAIPPGTVAVVPRERTEQEMEQLRVLEMSKAGNNIKQAGEDFCQGDLLLEAGTRLDAVCIAVLAAYGIKNIAVVRKPRVLVFCLAGDIVPYSLQPQPGQMRDSNGPLLASLLARDGAVLSKLEYMGQGDSDGLIKALQQGVEEADLIIFTGATYRNGDYEALQLMEKVGATALYWGVPVQPGSHTGAGTTGSCQLVALSGNPAACAVGYQLFIWPVLQAMQGLNADQQIVRASCLNGYPKKSGTRRFVRAHADCTEQGWEATVLPGQKPSMIRSLLKCNALIDLPAGTQPVEAGTKVSIMLLPNSNAF